MWRGYGTGVVDVRGVLEQGVLDNPKKYIKIGLKNILSFLPLLLKKEPGCLAR
jgi:hypothetical protein